LACWEREAGRDCQIEMMRMNAARWATLRPYIFSLLTVAVATAALYGVRAHLNTLNVGLLYLLVVTALALRAGTRPIIVAAVLAFLCFDVFFIPPYHTLTVARADHLLALVVFLGIAILISQLVVRVRQRTEDALRRGRQVGLLYDLSIVLLGKADLDDALAAIAQRVQRLFPVDGCAILLDSQGALHARATAGQPQIDPDDPNLRALARWSMEHRKASGLRRTRTKIRPPGPPGRAAGWNFAAGQRDRDTLLLPIATSQRTLGVLLVAQRRGRELGAEEIQILETFANQAALAIERILLTEEQTRTEILARSDELKSALLAAVSHDLRTPLASIKAAATTLLQPDVVWPEEERRDLLKGIDQEADRLNQLVANLLDLSRIESGTLKPDFDWYDPSEIIQDIVVRTRALMRGHQLRIDVPQQPPLLRVDYVEIRQVLINLLDNAAKYSPAGSRITLAVRIEDRSVEVQVRDQGIGIPAGEEERIFDRFYRVESHDRTIGAGVGLAICKGFVEAHGGRIWATRNTDRGTTIHFTLPIPEQVPVTEPAGPLVKESSA
jgi:two-component system sensor histidine kinase KdpD